MTMNPQIMVETTYCYQPGMLANIVEIVNGLLLEGYQTIKTLSRAHLNEVQRKTKNQT
jgi:hypothetical protein